MILGAQWWAIYFYNLKQQKVVDWKNVCKQIAVTYLNKMTELQAKITHLEEERGFSDELFNSFIDMNLNINSIVDPDFNMEL